MPTPHKHAELIKRWADDPSQEVWVFSLRAPGSGWQQIFSPNWDGQGLSYALGPKPAQPPHKMCSLAGVEFPMPEAAPAINAPYYTASIASHNASSLKYHYVSDEIDRFRLVQGFVHLTREAAEQHSRALLAANLAAIEAAR